MKKLLYIDLFCGAGGTSTGVEAATLGGQKCAHVIACVNHDPHAIASHLANHPEAKHYTEDIRTLDLTTTPKLNLVSAHKWHYLVNPQFASEGSSVDRPCFTLIARMDKKPPYIVTAETGPTILIYDNDSPMTVRIKEFMAMYGISDVRMRMLNITELKRIMGFPGDYVLVGTQTEQKKYIGNAVETHVATALCVSIAREINRVS